MDCEKFDQCVMGALYEELDELTYAALRRHVDGCSRCNAVYTALRATREAAVLPLVEPSEGLEDRVLDAAFAAQERTPLRRKVLGAVAWAGSHAMRPQLAMAALFFLVIGSSLLLLRARPGTVGSPLRVTERGAPAPDEQAQVEPQPSAAAAPSAAPSATVAANEAPAFEPAKRKEDAEAPGDKGAGSDAKALLAEARATRDRSGCAAAVGKFDEVGARHPATSYAADAMWDEASCYKSLGQADKARELLLALKANASYRDRVEAALAEPAMVPNNGNVQQQIASRSHAAMAAPAPMPPAASQPGPQATPRAAPASKPGAAPPTRAEHATPKNAVDQSAL